MLIKMTNDFHNTEVTLRVNVDHNGDAILSCRQVARMSRVLCGIRDCVCSAHGYRGYQEDVDWAEPSKFWGLEIHLRGH